MKRFLLGFVTAVLIGGGYLYSSGQLALPWAEKPKDQAPAQTEQAHAQSAQAGPPVEVAVYTVKPQEVVFTKDLAGRTSAYQVAEIRVITSYSIHYTKLYECSWRWSKM